jgi:hypothetical protein
MPKRLTTTEKRNRCWEAAEAHITRHSEVVQDVLDDLGQMYDNVKHMRWCQVQVANELIDRGYFPNLPYFEA